MRQIQWKCAKILLRSMTSPAGLNPLDTSNSGQVHWFVTFLKQKVNVQLVQGLYSPMHEAVSYGDTAYFIVIKVARLAKSMI